MSTQTVNSDSQLLAKRLRPLIKGDVYDDRVTRLLYSTDGSIYKLIPTVVVAPRDDQDIIRLVLFAQETGVPLTARGAGTGLAGESLTTGICVDFSRYLTGIIHFDPVKGRITTRPGAILDEINRHARRFGWQFGPDPSSCSRATVGGSLANNATGAHSLRYGYCSDNLLGLKVILADGRLITTDDSDWKDLERKAWTMLNSGRKTIHQYWPTVKRNRAGYNLKGMIQRAGGDLLKLFAGSEGTLGVFTEMTFQLVRIPAVKVVLSANFDEFLLSGRATNLILEFDPAAIELMDGTLIHLARAGIPQLAEILPKSQASLMAEFDGASLDEACYRMHQCRDRLTKEFGGHVQLLELIDPAEQRRHWAARKNAVPILFRQAGPAKPFPFVEDIAVDPPNLPQYLSGMQAIFSRYDLQASFYGHAGSGEFHIRPFINLREPLDRKKLSPLAKDAYELVWSLGGTISGEHATGIIRSWALRKQYGPTYEYMEQIKHLFDPAALLNPGKIIVTDTDLPIENLRADGVPSPAVDKPKLLYGDLGLFDLADVCNGCGECKSLDVAQLMCPIFRVNRDEYSSPRAKANLLREFLTGSLSSKDLLSPQAKRVIDSCLLCGNCLRECPSAVQTPRLIMELRAARRKLRGNRLIERLFVDGEYSEWLSSKFSPITNSLFAKKGVRRAFEMITGMDARSPMPPFAFPGLLTYLRRLAQRHRPTNPKIRALWFTDLFARYHDNQLALDIIRVCAANGIELIIPEQCSCNMPAMAYGYLEQARQAAQFNVDQFTRHLDEADMILCFEPTATLSLQKEYKYLIDDENLDAIAARVRDGCDFLLQLHFEKDLKFGSASQPLKLAYHCPCHLRLLQCGQPGLELLRLVDGLKVEHLPNQCCGLAGTFGLSRERYDLSQAIGKTLADAVVKGQYDALVSECSSCRMQLSHLTGLRAFHPVQFLARWYEGKNIL